MKSKSRLFYLCSFGIAEAGYGLPELRSRQASGQFQEEWRNERISLRYLRDLSPEQHQAHRRRIANVDNNAFDEFLGGLLREYAKDRGFTLALKIYYSH